MPSLMKLALLLIVIETSGISIERGETCWPLDTKPKYESFLIKYHFWSMQKNEMIYATNDIFRPESYNFDPTKRTAVLVHGFMGAGSANMINSLKDSLLNWADINVIVVGWEYGATRLFRYRDAAANTQYTAMGIKDLFSKLLDHWCKKGVTREHWGKVHFIGHSLGAHVVGQAAELLKVEDNFWIDRVTGLDPAHPCFEDPQSTLRLSHSNAKFVDVIHTDVAINGNHAFGILEPIGHMDFYVNGGRKQPGCSKYSLARYISLMRGAVDIGILNRGIDYVMNNGICDHMRSIEIFAGSIDQANSLYCRYWAVTKPLPWILFEAEKEKTLNKWSICAEMGINSELYFKPKFAPRATFYLRTGNEAPFCSIFQQISWNTKNYCL